jgi:hypothetical protein
MVKPTESSPSALQKSSLRILVDADLATANWLIDFRCGVGAFFFEGEEAFLVGDDAALLKSFFFEGDEAFLVGNEASLVDLTGEVFLAFFLVEVRL